jgi:hypothetical protein
VRTSNLVFGGITYSFLGLLVYPSLAERSIARYVVRWKPQTVWANRNKATSPIASTSSDLKHDHAVKTTLLDASFLGPRKDSKPKSVEAFKQIDPYNVHSSISIPTVGLAIQTFPFIC